MIFTNDFRATKEQYIGALEALISSDSPSVGLYLDILKYHYNQESRKITTGRLATHLGYKSANGIYGKMAKFFAMHLGMDEKLPKRLDGSTQWYRVISIGRAGSMDTIDNHFEYELIPELAEALEELSLV
ncbi:hypothetical protein [Vibrio harveyi]|uniref:hypothetical protein n=1 Tax=Vibrio harveyi TaxID=669 RepID=UPI0006803353|nr:hypothetical protein [Vibrio harveyi]